MTAGHRVTLSIRPEPVLVSAADAPAVVEA
jgi:hypothetical protein